MESAQSRLILNKEKIIQQWIRRYEEKLSSFQQSPETQLIDPISKFFDRICNVLKLARLGITMDNGNSASSLQLEKDHFANYDLPATLLAYEALFDVIRDALRDSGGYTVQEFEVISHSFLNQTRDLAVAYSNSTTEKDRELKTAFLTKVSHQIRTPLNAILGFTDLIKHDHLSKRQHLHYIDIIERNGKTLSELVEGLLEIAKTEAGIMSTEKAHADIPHESTKAVPIPVRYASDKILKDINILLVEDMKDNQLLIETYLRKTGAKLDIANDGAEGVEKALSKYYDVILMDIQMPVLDGNRAARKLRDAGYMRPMIALTAHAMKEEVDQSMRAGFNSLVSKPIDSNKLYGVIQSALGQTTPRL